MRLFIYNILTQIIIVLGRLRKKALFDNLILKERTFLTPRGPLEKWGTMETCCDCGLSHRAFLREKGIFWQPIRPQVYRYKFRAFAVGPSEFRSEEEWKK